MKQHVYVEPNKVGTDYVVGDVHGCYRTLMKLLEKVYFNPEKDRLFSVGDLVDRGNHSLKCLDLLHEPWCFAVRGNHEQMMLDYIDVLANTDTHPSALQHVAHVYRCNGGGWFVDDLAHSMQMYALQLARNMPLVMTVGDVGLVHADAVYDDWNKLLDDLTVKAMLPMLENKLLWSRTRVRTKNCMNIKNIARVFIGHTVLPEWKAFGNVIYIDTGCCFKQKLTLFRLDGTFAAEEHFSMEEYLD